MDVEIRGNTLQTLFQGIQFSAGQGASGGQGNIINHLARIKITDNLLTNVGPTGISGAAAFYIQSVDLIANNSTKDIRITCNQISEKAVNKPGLYSPGAMTAMNIPRAGTSLAASSATKRAAESGSKPLP